jgi:hypothetical protein
MAETTADVRRDIELTRERMSSTLAQLEQKLNLTQMVKDNPWPALGIALGAGLLLSGSKADVKAAAAAAVATKGASNKLGTALDTLVADLMQSVGDVLQGHVDRTLGEVKRALGATGSDGQRSPFANYSGARQSVPQLADTETHPTSGAASANWPPQAMPGIERAD